MIIVGMLSVALLARAATSEDETEPDQNVSSTQVATMDAEAEAEGTPKKGMTGSNPDHGEPTPTPSTEAAIVGGEERTTGSIAGNATGEAEDLGRSNDSTESGTVAVEESSGKEENTTSLLGLPKATTATTGKESFYVLMAVLLVVIAVTTLVGLNHCRRHMPGRSVTVVRV